MRVALVAPLVSAILDPPEGGAQAVVADLARGLTGRGHEVVLYAGHGSRVEGVDVVCLSVDPLLLRGDVYRHGGAITASRAMVSAYREVYAHLGRRAWDVIHNHGFDTPAVTEAGRAGIAVLHTLHLPPTEPMVAAVAEARRTGPPTWCVGVSGAHAAAWKEASRPLDGVLANGVPVADIPFSPVATRRAVVAGRFSQEKGIGESIAAAREAGWPVTVFAGPYDHDYEGAIRRRWAHDDGVTFHGHAPRRQLWRAFGTAAAVVCMSRWDEPFGMVAAEAQAAGTPVVASRRGGMVDIVQDGVTGWLVPPDQPGRAAAALERTLALDRHACRRHAVDDLGLESSLDRHEQLYEKLRLCAPRPAGSRA